MPKNRLNKQQERELIINELEALEKRARKVNLIRIANVLKKTLTNTTFLLVAGEGEENRIF